MCFARSFKYLAVSYSRNGDEKAHIMEESTEQIIKTGNNSIKNGNRSGAENKRNAAKSKKKEELIMSQYQRMKRPKYIWAGQNKRLTKRPVVAAGTSARESPRRACCATGI